MGQAASDMGCHVIRAFGGVAIASFLFRHKSFEEVSEIECDVGVGILLDDKGAGGVLDEDDQNSVDGCLFAEPVGYLAGERVKAFAAGGNGDCGVYGHCFQGTAQSFINSGRCRRCFSTERTQGGRRITERNDGLEDGLRNEPAIKGEEWTNVFGWEDRVKEFCLPFVVVGPVEGKA